MSMFAAHSQGPQGPQGPQGLAGPQGIQGSQGPQGSAGSQGPQGPAGIDGAVGIQGPAGAAGLQGPQGPPGQAASNTEAVGFYYGNSPAASQPMLQLRTPYAFTLAANLAGSTVFVGQNPTAAATYTIKKNGATVGTVTIAPNGLPALNSGAISVAINDTFEIIAPAVADATLGGVSVTLQATRAS